MALELGEWNVRAMLAAMPASLFDDWVEYFNQEAAEQERDDCGMTNGLASDGQPRQSTEEMQGVFRSFKRRVEKSRGN